MWETLSLFHFLYSGEGTWVYRSKKKIIDFLSSLISKQQCGFMRDHSCWVNFWLSYLTFTILWIAKFTLTWFTLGRQSHIMSCFWSCSHWESQAGPLWMWFKEYLTNWQHFVSFSGATSSLLPVYVGVPQGSILGPILFLVYVNDILTAIISSTAACLLMTPNSLSESTMKLWASNETDINSLQPWCEKWLMSLHPDNCTVVHYGLSNLPDPECSLDGVSIKPIYMHRDLCQATFHGWATMTTYAQEPTGHCTS